jgi:hypothetical protein
LPSVPRSQTPWAYKVIFITILKYSKVTANLH